MKRNLKTKQLSFVTSWLVGSIACLLFLLISAALLATLMLNETIKYETANIIGKGLLMLCMLLGTMIALLKTEMPYIYVAASICGTIILLQLLVSAFSVGGIKLASIINSLIIVAGCAAGLAIRLKIKTPKTKLKRVYR